MCNLRLFLYLCSSKCMNMQETKEISTYKQGLRERILDMALRSFTMKGIRAVRMDDVAADLSISKRTLYELYENKEVLLFECVRKFHQDRTKLLDMRVSSCSNVIEIVMTLYKLKVEESRNVVPQFYADLARYPQVARYLSEQHQHARANFQKFIERGIGEGYFRDNLNYDLAARLFEALGQYISINHLYQDYSIEDIFTNLVFVSLRGFCTEKGIQALDKIL